MECSLCNASFSCGSDENCWCFGMPGILKVDPLKECLCRECLIKEMSQLVNERKIEITDALRNEIARIGIPDYVQENIDFNYNAEGKYVLSRWYLLRRSFCCKNGCSNCPY